MGTIWLRDPQVLAGQQETWFFLSLCPSPSRLSGELDGNVLQGRYISFVYIYLSFYVMIKKTIKRIIIMAVKTVKDLIEILNQLPSNAQVIMSKDAEGNDFSPFYDASQDIYHPETTWYGYVRHLDDDHNDEEGQLQTPNCVILWPVN